uniref:Uncharacterized protein LOC102800903 n=1 Tax=Saccoglossus kowalevskii TaxID=10224 RepID=A0ABM0LXZ5_SACKO|nr:PREDICTED: uncharacterized protein LOC102800903 [Saccoglossus kowalevskii]
MERRMMAPRPLMVAIAVTSAISFFSYLAAWLLRKSKKEKPRFGQEIRDEEFLLGDDVIQCNHGSYGTVPKRVLHARGEFLKEAEYSPDEFMRLKSPIYYEEALLSVGDFVGANIEHMVFVENTTTGINTVLKSMKFKKGESILITNLTYPAVINTVKDVCSDPELGMSVVTLDIKFPIRSKEEIYNNIEISWKTIHLSKSQSLITSPVHPPW